MFVNYILSFSLVRLCTIRDSSFKCVVLWWSLRSPAKDMTITIVMINPQKGNWAGVWITSCLEEMVLRIWGYWKDVSWAWTIEAGVGFWPLKDVVGFFGCLPTEILNITRCAPRWGGVSIVWLAMTFKNCVSFHVLPWTEVKK